MVAAVSMLLISLLASKMIGDQRLDNEAIYTTGFGERQKIVLPDGSVVDLNANSTLKLGNRWDQGIREVWLEGEAYFEVEKYLANSVKFTVHTNGPDVEVVGTHFNVDSRKEETLVYLEDGKVCLILKDLDDAEKEVFLVPGELAYFTKDDYHVTKQNSKQATSLVSWKIGYLVYDNTSLSEVMQDITFTYGKRVKVTDESLLSRKINGAIPTNNLDEFIKVTELLFGVHAEIEESQILFKSH
jgi:ferric-dicitrate binding protein FerR (iron transport regulator)